MNADCAVLSGFDFDVLDSTSYRTILKRVARVRQSDPIRPLGLQEWQSLRHCVFPLKFEALYRRS
jgi:hypothetical protein